MSDFEYKLTPDDVRVFLESRGWKEWRTGAPGWTRPGMPALGRHRHDDYSWEQAVAVETVNFLTLGGVQSR